MNAFIRSSGSVLGAYWLGDRHSLSPWYFLISFRLLGFVLDLPPPLGSASFAVPITLVKWEMIIIRSYVNVSKLAEFYALTFTRRF